MHAMPSVWRQFFMLCSADILLLIRSHPGPGYLRMLLICYTFKNLILLGFPVSWPYVMLVWVGGAAGIYRTLALYFDTQIDRWNIGTHDPKYNEPWIGFLLGAFMWFFPIKVFRHYQSPLELIGLEAPEYFAFYVSDYAQVIDALRLNPDTVLLAQSVMLPLILLFNHVSEQRAKYEPVMETPRRAEMSFPDVQ